MPIKIPKGFQRRKSSGNALEEINNPPEGSFKVFERSDGVSKTFDGGHALRKQVERAPPPPPKHDTANRASGGTDTSLSTVGPHGSANSSLRLSTSSTTASSIENRSEGRGGTRQPPFKDIPVPPSASARSGPFPRPGVRTVSPGILKSHSPLTSTPQRLSPVSGNWETYGNARDRNVSSSTTSTLTPPRLDDSDLAIEDSELDDFKYMFDNFGIRGSREVSPARSSPVQMQSSPVPPPAPKLLRTNVPSPLTVGQSHEVNSSPYSAASYHSQDRLMRSPSPTKTVTAGSPLAFNYRHDDSESQNMPVHRHSPVPRVITPDDRPEPLRTSPIKRKAAPSSFPKTFQPPDSEYEQYRRAVAPENPELSGVQGQRQLSPGKPPFDLDLALAESADLAAKWEDTKTSGPKLTRPGKVMTPAQFERYREDLERERRMKRGINESDSEDEKDHYEDDDELEREQEATRQRRKQEAHLAVYRQTMMKVTGEQPGPRPTSGLSGMESQLSANSRLPGLQSKSSGEEDEDEDVPLGILAAHGFPNKNKPPSRPAISPSPSHLGIPGQTMSAPTTPAPEGEGRGNLPVFARNLPKDPYMGASLINPLNRESLAMGGGSSVYGVPTNPVPGPYPVHPSGLVGVIAGEERARAMRRGSPNVSGTYEHPGMVRSQTMGNLPHPGMMMPGMLTPGDQAQIQMSQQMNQMMQMQFQWMQQMQMQVSQMQGGQPGMMASGMNTLAPPNPGQRPQSMPMPDMVPMPNPAMGNWNRSSSFVPSMNGIGGYAPSLAPSERSNVGLASRYRPVSINPEADLRVHKRSSTFTSSTARPWSSYEHQAAGGRRSPTGATIRTVNPGARKGRAGSDDEDDEEGWAEMKAKRDKKKKGWAMRKKKDELRDVFPGGL